MFLTSRASGWRTSQAERGEERYPRRNKCHGRHAMGSAFLISDTICFRELCMMIIVVVLFIVYLTPNSPLSYSLTISFFLSLSHSPFLYFLQLSLSPYFSVRNCFRGFQLILRSLFRIELRRAPLDPGEGWGDDVIKTEWIDMDTGSKMATVYFDIFQRTGKMDGCATFIITCSKQLPQGETMTSRYWIERSKSEREREREREEERVSMRVVSHIMCTFRPPSSPTRCCGM